MKRFSVFKLFVIEIDGIKFICETIIPGKEYREVLTKRKITLKDNYKIKCLADYYSILIIMNYQTKEPMMLTKDRILKKYIDINQPEYYDEQTDLCSIIHKIMKQPELFYQMVGEQLTREEREYIKSKLSANNDIGSIGKYKVLKLNRINEEN